MLYRRGILLKSIAIVLACTMPLCCCFVSAVAGGNSSCCSISSTPACCEKPTVAWLDELFGPVEGEDQEPSDDTCSCVKVFAPSQDWTPPVDTIGTDLPAFFDVAIACHMHADAMGMQVLRPPPLIDINQLGFGNAPSLRGIVILQV